MAFCDLPLADKLCTVGDAVSFASDPGEAIGNWMAKSAGELAAAGADLAAEAVDTTTRVDLNAAWFRDNYEMILPISLVLLVATFCAQLVRAAIRRDGQALTQAFAGTATGVIFAFTAITFTTVAIEVVDALSDGLFKTANLSVDSAVRRIVKVAAIPGLSAMGWLVAVFAGVGAAVGAFLYWCVMVARKVGILVLVILAPFAGAGGGWEVARRWRRGWIEATATLVVSKLLMTIIFVLGVTAIGRSEAKDGVAALADVMAGIVIMALVLTCPYATFKFVHWAASEGSDGETLHRSGGAGAQLARQHAERAGRKAIAMAATAGTGGAAPGAGAAPQGPDAVPGGFPGDIATNPTPDTGGKGGGTNAPSSGEGITGSIETPVQPSPASPRGDSSGNPGPAPSSGFMSAPASPADTSTPLPQGTPPAPDPVPSAGTSAPPPPSTGL
ncbi:conjugal transfer protein TrbL family protein [Streptomyces sp. NPDC002680]|uniref:SCO6881 family protein n=1 Tax=Streptomyces sp. NPDC002680 TaxID=3364659 RepID=UPI0036BA65DF